MRVMTHPSLPRPPGRIQLRLRFSPTSPFVRKVRVFAAEVGLDEAIELIPCDVWAQDSDIITDNPLSKVPVLIGADGTFIGSLLCCEYLDSLHEGARLIPQLLSMRWPALQRHALADGLAEAAVAFVTENIRRPPEFRYRGYLDRQLGKITRVLDTLEPTVATWESFDLASITLASALTYLDLRLPFVQWRLHRYQLEAWLAHVEQRASMLATRYRL